MWFRFLCVRVDLGVWEVSGSFPGAQRGYRMVKYEALTPQCGRSVVWVHVLSMDIGVVICEVMTPQCMRTVVQVLFVKVDIGVVIYEAMTHQCGKVSDSGPGY